MSNYRTIKLSPTPFRSLIMYAEIFEKMSNNVLKVSTSIFSAKLINSKYLYVVNPIQYKMSHYTLICKIKLSFSSQ